MESARNFLEGGDKALARLVLEKAGDKVYEVRGCSISRTFLFEDDAGKRSSWLGARHLAEHLPGSLRVKRLTFVVSCFCLLIDNISAFV